MSVDASSQVQEGSAQPRASLRSVYGVLFGFAILMACLGSLAVYGAWKVPAGPALAKSFELASVPFELSLDENLNILPSGESVYVFTSPRAEALRTNAAAELALAASNLETEADAAPESDGEADGEEVTDVEASEGGDSGTGRWTPTDWTQAKPVTEGGPPSEVFLVNYPLSHANRIIGSQFQRVEWKELKYIESKGGRTAIDGGKLTWNGYAADYVLEREFRPGMKFQDRLRVNLTVNGECWVAYGVWPEQEAGSEEPMSEILGALLPHELPTAEL